MKTILMCACGALAVSAGAFTLVSPGHKARIVVAPQEEECVLLAAKDLAADVKKIADVDLEVVSGGVPQAGDLSIQTTGGDWESYTVEEKDGVLAFRGADPRGTMFAVYDFIERYLGVDPMQFWSGVPYPRKAELVWEKVEIRQVSPTVKFRGWFINDEDLLTKWRERSGTRDYLVYPYYHDVMNLSIAEAVAESLVRCRFNMIIPDSFLNISNPPEAAILEACARRGVFLTMHHIEPMGTSGFVFTDYWKKRGRDLKYSYFSNPAEVEEVWRHQAKQWAKFPNVVWQIGLRGSQDRPMWNEDKSIPTDDAGRARIISAAMAKQIAILDELGIPKDRRFTSTTLWAEGAYFFAKGLLKVPEGTTIVFADNNGGWRWQDDFREVPRDTTKHTYGVYYHHQLIGPGPHVASFVPAARTFKMMKEAQAKQSATYAIFNVSNLREFIYGIDATAKMTWNLETYDPEAWTKTWLAARLPTRAADWQSVLNVHYNAMQIHPTLNVPMYMDGQTTWVTKGAIKRMMSVLAGKKKAKMAVEPFVKVCTAKEHPDPFHKALQDTYPRAASPRDDAQRLAAQREGYDEALRMSRYLLAQSPEAEKTFAYDHVLYPALVMRELADSAICVLRAEEALNCGDRATALAEAKAALAAQERINAAGKVYCHGKWSDWYRGCEKINFSKITEMLQELVQKLGA
ncbi:MAG: glycosyl hydrolase 115 family protein [bacterium]|nr:glycosyl hydrolase 115 family protein [bacterium]